MPNVIQYNKVNEKGTVIIMAKNDTIHVRVDENVKVNAEQTLAMLGLTISEAVNMMLCQASDIQLNMKLNTDPF